MQQLRINAVKWLAALCGLALMVAGSSAFAAISGTAHDWSSAGTGVMANTTLAATGNDQVCVVCHAPHGAPNASVGLLWNRSSAGGTYTLYGTTLRGTTTGGITQTTKLCLSCHDGVVALENYGGTTGGSTFPSGPRNLGTDPLQEEHPVGLAYEGTTKGLQADTSTFGTGTIADVLIDASASGGATNSVECMTCHDVHNAGDAATVGVKFLRVTPSGSAICQACHNK